MKENGSLGTCDLTTGSSSSVGLPYMVFGAAHTVRGENCNVIKT